MNAPATQPQRVTHGGNVDAAVRDVDLDDLYTYAHQVFDLDRVGEYRRAQAAKVECDREDGAR